MSDIFRRYFPFFNNANNSDAYSNGAHINQNLSYLDSSATTQKLQSVLDKQDKYHHYYNANVHRGSYAIAQQATREYEQSREAVAAFLGTNKPSEIVFTSGTTEAINIIANGLSLDMLNGSTILIAASEHHANIVPWQQLAKRLGLSIVVLPLNKDGQFTRETLQTWLSLINEKTALIAIAHVSNVLGNIYPLAEICKQAKAVNALTVIDGTQAGAHIDIDVSALACDFYAISGHKMYASTGIGVLFGKFKLLQALSPSKFGGEMIKHVTWQHSEFGLPPLKFEGGTPNIAGAISLLRAIEFIQAHKLQISQHEKTLYEYLLAQIAQIKNIRILGNVQDSIAILSFTIDGIHANDIAVALGHKNVAIRAGHHCAMPLMAELGIEGCARVSLACYSSKNDIDQFIQALQASLAQLGDVTTISQVTSNTGSSDAIAKLVTLFSNATDWNEKHRLLLLQSKHLAALSADLRHAHNQVQGCEAQVWLDLKTDTYQNIQLLAYSDSKVVRGLLALLLEYVNVKIQTSGLANMRNIEAQLNEFLKQLGLPHYFSHGRRDGMKQVMHTIAQLLNS